MRKRFLIYASAIVVAVVGTLSGCKKFDIVFPPKPPHSGDSTQSIAYVIDHDSTYSLLDTALDKAGLTATLNDSTKSFTLFAPDNDAFAAAGITQASIDSMSVDSLKAFLLYHVLASKLSSSQLGDSSSRASAEGSPLYFSKNGGGTYVNGNKIERPDRLAKNGYIQGIKKVLEVPTESIADIIAGDSTLSLWVAAVKQALSDSGAGRTYFLPTDSAFEAAGFSDSSFAGTDSASRATADSVVREHIVSGVIFSSALSPSFEPRTLLGDTLSFGGASPAFTVKVKGSAAQAAKIVKADLIGTNGVVHVIDRVLKKE